VGSEAADYDYKTNRCRAGCGHYTQVIWRDTKELGCAVARRGSRELVGLRVFAAGRLRRGEAVLNAPRSS
jgi:hypothetical protein